jgi:PAS domain S-box-containing protein
VFGNEHLAEIEANDRRVFDEGRAIEFEERLTVAGELRTYRSIKAPITAMGGADIVLCGITLDITEQKLAEEALRKSERRFRQLADVMPQIVWTADAEGMTDYYNRRWYELTGLKAEKHEPGDWQSFVHPGDVDTIKDHWRRSLQSGAPFQIEIRLKDAVAGAYHWHLARCVPVRNATGQIIRWYGTSTDIDEQKRTAEVARFLAEASAALASLVNHESTLQLVAQLAVPFFADWCTVDMLAADGSLRRLAVAHIDPAKVALAHDLYQRFPPNPEAPKGVWTILRTGKPELVSEISDELLNRSSRGAKRKCLNRHSSAGCYWERSERDAQKLKRAPLKRGRDRDAVERRGSFDCGLDEVLGDGGEVAEQRAEAVNRHAFAGTLVGRFA